MPLNFPDNPVDNQVYSPTPQKAWVYNASQGTWLASNVSSQGTKVTVQDAAPQDSDQGDLWFNSETGSLNVNYDDETSEQWVNISSSGIIESDDIINDNTMLTASESTLATSSSIKAYVDSIPKERSLSLVDITFDTSTDETILTNLGLAGLQLNGFDGSTKTLAQIQSIISIPCSQFFPDIADGVRTFLAHNGQANKYRPWFQYTFTPTRVGKIAGSISFPGRGLPEFGPNLLVSDITEATATTLAHELIDNTSMNSSGHTHRTIFTLDIDSSQVGVERTIVFSIISPKAASTNWRTATNYDPQVSLNASLEPGWPTALPIGKTDAITTSLGGRKESQVRLMMHYIAGIDTQ